MGDANKHARKVLLSAWERYKHDLLTSQTREERLLSSGGLLAISRVLHYCRHTGDGRDPIHPDEWENEAMKAIRDAQGGTK